VNALYPNIVESTIETKLHAKKILKKYKRAIDICKKTAKNEHSPLFRLRQDKTTGKIYCCLLSQSLSDRMFEKMQPPHLAPWDKKVDKESFFTQSLIFNESIKSDLNDAISQQSTKKLQREFRGKSPTFEKTPSGRNSIFALAKTGATAISHDFAQN
jgi:hypothetical protein